MNPMEVLKLGASLPMVSLRKLTYAVVVALVDHNVYWTSLAETGELVILIAIFLA